MSTPVDAEQAWRDLQRIRVPQERVYDEIERGASGGPGAAYATAAVMWVFVACTGLDLPRWGVWLALVAYVALLGALAVAHGRRTRLQLHRSRYTWRTFAAFAAGALVTGGTSVLSGHLLDSLEPVYAGPLRATATTTAFLLFIGPANRWATGSLRGHGARTAPGGAVR
ncbi:MULTISPECIES: hypothetical protein [unclassified Streptomyces]|uniref:hypothetical protein n=1 Tax=unclassified Streptomyces TaxID=2593676 RepID=UPI003700485B